MDKNFLLLLIPVIHLHLSVALDVKNGLLPNFDGYPKWASADDRNLLLNSRSMRPNITVAKDGTGDYRTIGEAVEAISKMRKGSDRFLIHVRGGIYKEYIEVKMDNIMFIGDGINATIVTGNRNYVDGTATVGSATFGEFILLFLCKI